MSDSNKLVLTAIIGILVGLILGRLLWYAKVPNSLDNSNNEANVTAGTEEDQVSATNEAGEESGTIANPSISEPTETPSFAPSDLSVSVGTQPAGKSALVNIVTNQTVWAVVRDNNAGVAGKVLGAKHVDAGSLTAEIPLQRATEAGKSYFVVLQPYNDGELDLSPKTVLKDAAGKDISAVFTVK